MARIEKVGIFFFINGEILMDAVSLKHGEPYGEALQHGSHYEYWESLVPKNNIERKFKARAYDAFPRGRVLFFTEKKTFILYSDRCLMKPKILNRIKDSFCLKDAVIESDEHYQCSRCNPYFID